MCEWYDLPKKSLETLMRSYDFTLSSDGELLGLVAGDMGYEGTGIFVSRTKNVDVERCVNACAGAANPKPGELARLRKLRDGVENMAYAHPGIAKLLQEVDGE